MEEFDIKKAWQDILQKLEKRIPESTFEPWILPLEPHCFDENGFTLLSGHTLAIQILNKSYYNIIKEAMSEVLEKDVDFRIIYSEELSKKLRKTNRKLQKQENINSDSSKIRKNRYENLQKMQSSANLNLKYSFENFVPGENSKLAYMAAKSVAENPGKKYNPLFLYGGVGLGKTHLMQAIGHYILMKHQNLKVKYVKTEDFVNDYINSVFKFFYKHDKMSNFRQKYRNADVLLIDDIQFIEGKERTEIEIFNTFEALHNSGKQIVLTSDRPPSAIPNLSDRLRSRFEWGLMADIQIPDFETRAAIVCKLCENNSLPLVNDVILFLAKNYNQNIRELEGAFIKIKAFHEFQEEPVKLTIDVVKRILNFSENTSRIEVIDIIDAVADHFKLQRSDILSSAKSAKISHARSIAMFLGREVCNESFSQLAKDFGRKHTTIMYSHEKVQEALKKDQTLYDNLCEIKKKLNVM